MVNKHRADAGTAGLRRAEADLADGVAVVTALLGARLPEVTRSVYRALADEVSELQGGKRLLDLLYSSVESNIETIFDALQHDIPLQHLQPPSAALEYARRLAQHGVPVAALIRAYRLGQQELLRLALAEVRRSGLDPEVNLEVFGQLTTIVSNYLDWISQHVLVIYEAEQQRWLENRSYVRGEQVREILVGTQIDVDRAGAALGYPLRATQLALVTWFGEHSSTPGIPGIPGIPGTLADLERAVGAIAETLAARSQPLFVAEDRVSGWAWIALPAPVASAQAITAGIHRALADAPDALHLAVGSPLPGVDGFRRSHRQALQARAVAAAGSAPQRLTFAGDPGLRAAALLGSDLDAARDWVADVLGPLATDSDGDARLRETLRVFLRHGSYKDAAEELNLHFNSVKYRVRRAVERRGKPIAEDRLDVELALLVCRHYAGAAGLPAPRRRRAEPA